MAERSDDLITGLALMPKREHENRVFSFQIAVKRDEPGLAMGDEQFAQFFAGETADQRVSFKNCYRFANRGNNFGGNVRIAG